MSDMVWEEGQRRRHLLNSEGRPVCGAPADQPPVGRYRLGDPIPPAGTRVVHEELGAGAVADFGVQPHLGQWWVEFDVPLGDGETRHVWVYPYLLRPEVSS